MKLIRFFFLFIFPSYLFSCTPQQKLPYYLDNISDTSSKIDSKFPELHIQKDDLLSIQVYSASTQPQISDILYNLPPQTTTVNSSNTNGNAQQTGVSNGFLVDVNGNIEYPRLGTLHVEGLTKLQLADMIKKKIPDSVLSNPSVIVRFLNFKVNVLGQVNHEGIVNFPGERLTIMEALGLAGGITDYGKKNDIRVVREINGTREIGTIDLSSKNLFDSPYYNLMQNDIVIVYPTKQKIKMVDQSIVAQRISLSLSVITAAAFIYNIFK